jgi:Ca2+-binding RTX toxin-like protein
MATFYGNDLDDSTSGIFPDDNFYGGDGNDFLAGTDTANEIYGGQGNDVLLGAQYLTFPGLSILATPARNPTFARSGNDYLEGGTGDDIAYGGDGDDIIYGGNGNESGIISSYGSQVFAGGLFGGNGNDFMDGANGTDLLDGGTGSDTLDGGAGRDTLAGGLGRDFLTGDSGRDLFDFNALNETGLTSATRDQILDFQRRQDDIDLSTIDANTDGSGNHAFTFIGTKTFSDHAGELRLRDLGSDVVVQSDVDGDGRKDFEILVKNVGMLSSSDFIL